MNELFSLWERFYPRLRRVTSDTERFLLFIAWLNKFLEQKGLGRIVIVGDFAVELYTGSTYRTLDVDIIVEGDKALNIVKSFLKQLSSEGTSRVYLIPIEFLASKAIDIVGNMYVSRKNTVRINVDEYHVYVEPPEELLVKYLVAWKFWKSEEDRDKVIILAKTLIDKLDIDYIRQRAKQEGVEDLLNTVLDMVR